VHRSTVGHDPLKTVLAEDKTMIMTKRCFAIAVAAFSAACLVGCSGDGERETRTGNGTGGTTASTGGAGGEGASAAQSGGSGGTVDAGGSGGTAPATPAQIWSFDTSTEDWVFGWSNVEGLIDASLLEHDADEGDPDPGSLIATIPFTEPSQKVTVAVNFEAVDLSGNTVQARVKLTSGMNILPENPGGAKLYVKSGADYVYADSGWVNLQAAWTTLTLSASNPGGYVDTAAGTYDPKDIREIGIEFATGEAGEYVTATVNVDSVGY
jgi:hypothetical protein